MTIINYLTFPVIRSLVSRYNDIMFLNLFPSSGSSTPPYRSDELPELITHGKISL